MAQTLGMGGVSVPSFFFGGLYLADVLIGVS